MSKERESKSEGLGWGEREGIRDVQFILFLYIYRTFVEKERRRKQKHKNEGRHEACIGDAPPQLELCPVDHIYIYVVVVVVVVTVHTCMSNPNSLWGKKTAVSR
jgi:hypothetical protein